MPAPRPLRLVSPLDLLGDTDPELTLVESRVPPPEPALRADLDGPTLILPRPPEATEDGAQAASRAPPPAGTSLGVFVLWLGGAVLVAAACAVLAAVGLAFLLGHLAPERALGLAAATVGLLVSLPLGVAAAHTIGASTR